MKKFFREYWFYILAPVLVVALLLVAMIFMNGGEGDNPFVYNIF